MKASDKSILIIVGVLLLTVGFYFFILAPKRERAAELGDEVSSLEGSISEQEQVATFAEEARKQFPTYYGRLVVLGKAVPEQADTASMLVQLDSIASRKSVDFRGIKLTESASGSGTSATAPAASASTSTASAPATEAGAAPAESTETSSTGAAAASAGSSAVPTAPATEATAATLPIGATIGPAGLPTLPYQITFRGGFFDIAGYLGGLDSLVQIREGSGQVSVDGRLFTVDGFALKGGGPSSDPVLEGTLSVTSYVVPAEQGLTGGATPGGPAPAPATPTAPTTPASAVTP